MSWAKGRRGRVGQVDPAEPDFPEERELVAVGLGIGGS